MHKLLERQLRRIFSANDTLPDGVLDLAGLVDAAYAAFDEDRVLNERSMNIASRELFDQNVRLRCRHEALQRAQLVDRERRQLQATIEAMERVLALVGHELRTPVAGIRAMAECLLADGAQTQVDSRSFLGSIREQAMHLSDTLNQLLEVTVLSSGRANWKWSRFSPSTVCNRAVTVMGRLLDRDRVHLIASLDTAELMMMGDAGAIERLVINLLSNAIKHTPSGQIKLQAIVPRTEKSGWISIVVQDTGKGIPAQILEELGQPFRLNSGFTGAAHIHGAGLGLTICREIAAAHGGTLAVSSELDQGSVFTARLRTDLIGPVDRTEEIIKIEVVPRVGAATGVCVNLENLVAWPSRRTYAANSHC